MTTTTTAQNRAIELNGLTLLWNSMTLPVITISLYIFIFISEYCRQLMTHRTQSTLFNSIPWNVYKDVAYGNKAHINSLKTLFYVFSTNHLSIRARFTLFPYSTTHNILFHKFFFLFVIVYFKKRTFKRHSTKKKPLMLQWLLLYRFHRITVKMRFLLIINKKKERAQVRRKNCAWYYARPFKLEAK